MADKNNGNGGLFVVGVLVGSAIWGSGGFISSAQIWKRNPSNSAKIRAGFA
jgi:hypothetical protein